MDLMLFLIVSHQVFNYTNQTSVYLMLFLMVSHQIFNYCYQTFILSSYVKYWFLKSLNFAILGSRGSLAVVARMKKRNDHAERTKDECQQLKINNLKGIMLQKYIKILKHHDRIYIQPYPSSSCALMSREANRQMRGNLRSWESTNTFTGTRLGSHRWLIKRATLPYLLASIQ